MSDINNINESVINAYGRAIAEQKESENWVESAQRHVAQIEHDLDEAFGRLKSAQEGLAMRELMVKALEGQYGGLDAARSLCEANYGSMAILDVEGALRAIQEASGG